MKLNKYIKKLNYHEHRAFFKTAREEMKVNRTSIYAWITERTRPTPYHSIQLEEITHGKVTKEESRPDVFGGKK